MRQLSSYYLKRNFLCGLWSINRLKFYNIKMWSIYTFILKPKFLLKGGGEAFTGNDRSNDSPVTGTVTINPVSHSLAHSCEPQSFLQWGRQMPPFLPSFKRRKVKVKSLSRVRLFATPWTVAYQAPRSMGFSRQEYWSRLPFPSPGDLSDPGIEPRSSAL